MIDGTPIAPPKTPPITEGSKSPALTEAEKAQQEGERILADLKRSRPIPPVQEAALREDLGLPTGEMLPVEDDPNLPHEKARRQAIRRNTLRGLVPVPAGTGATGSHGATVFGVTFSVLALALLVFGWMSISPAVRQAEASALKALKEADRAYANAGVTYDNAVSANESANNAGNAAGWASKFAGQANEKAAAAVEAAGLAEGYQKEMKELVAKVEVSKKDSADSSQRAETAASRAERALWLVKVNDIRRIKPESGLAKMSDEAIGRLLANSKSDIKNLINSQWQEVNQVAAQRSHTPSDINQRLDTMSGQIKEVASVALSAKAGVRIIADDSGGGILHRGLPKKTIAELRAIVGTGPTLMK